MSDDKVLGSSRPLQLAGLAGRLLKDKDKDKPKDEAEEDSCQAFGFLRGFRDRSVAIEFRFLNRNSAYFAYHCLVSFTHNPSVGILMKFTGDIVTLVLLRGSNLDAPIPGRDMNLTDRGLQRQRITWVAEMEEEALRKAAVGEPTIDRIDIQEFESQTELREWVQKHAPGFVRLGR